MNPSGKGLVIVESPAKAATIYSYLGGKYQVLASKGHIFDLPKAELGIDIANGFEPLFILMPQKQATLQSIVQAASRASHVLIATDPDREGEAIGFHIYEAIKEKNRNVSRILFTEVTKKAILAAIQNPGKLRQDVVEAQLSRRVLDRLLGYTLSPFLWKQVQGGLSAGRVQSVVLRWICERDAEIANFEKEPYYSIAGKGKGQDGSLREFQLCDTTAKPIYPRDPKFIFQLLQQFTGKKPKQLTGEFPAQASVEVKSADTSEKKRFPPPPFTTSSLQQDAHKTLGFTGRKTMQLAQRLYEGTNCGSMGKVGLITYMRTDSMDINPQFAGALLSHIRKNFGKEYAFPRKNKKKLQNAQGAHEAIRPTSLQLPPEKLQPYLAADALALYRLIWKRTLASHMAAEVYLEHKVVLHAEGYDFLIKYPEAVFPGFTIIYGKAMGQSAKFVPLKVGERVRLQLLKIEEKETEPPPAYTEASLVKKMEATGIGRPSTYTPTIEKLLQRKYIIRKKKSFASTALGRQVVATLLSDYAKYLDDSYTSSIESQLDEVEEGTLQRKQLLQGFYQELTGLKISHAKKSKARKAASKQQADICPQCKQGKVLLKRTGKGKQYKACSRFPHCDFMQYI
ncbi:MAG: type I DNA topoisomerase [Spirochaetota bacterium]